MMTCIHHSIDIDPLSLSTIKGDVTCPIVQAQLHTLFTQLQAQGYYIIMHASPPCEAYSVLQRTSSLTPEQRAVNLAYSNIVSGIALHFMRQYADAWTLENPSDSALWVQPALFSITLLTVIVHYCRFGGSMRKSIRIAFSSKALLDRFGPAQLCIGPICNSISLQPPDRITRGHVDIKTLPHAERSRIPSQLATKLNSIQLDQFLSVESEQEAMGSRSVVGYYGVHDVATKKGTAMIVFNSGVPLEWRMPAEFAITYPWQSLAMLREFCVLTNWFNVVGILEGPRESDGKLLIRFRDFVELEWHAPAGYADQPRI